MTIGAYAEQEPIRTVSDIVRAGYNVIAQRPPRGPRRFRSRAGRSRSKEEISL